MRRFLDALCAMHDVRPEELTDVRGHRLPLRRSWQGVARGRAAVVGDAAGLIDPLSGDGMFEAFLSSEIATATALDLLAGRVRGMEPYGLRVQRTLAGHAATAWLARATLERLPALTFQVLRPTRPGASWATGSRPARRRSACRSSEASSGSRAARSARRRADPHRRPPGRGPAT